MTTRSTNDDSANAATLEERVLGAGREFRGTLTAVLDAIPGTPARSQDLAVTLDIDKVLSSRFLKAARHRDPLAVAHDPRPDRLGQVRPGGGHRLEVAAGRPR